ncbi:hypothetical protein HRG84_22545 [Flavisolibacter sp. BT320]|nr:hypothetical protein [Flavisolibacter longurius]
MNVNNGFNIKGEWSDDKHSVKVQLQVLLFIEDDIHYAYIPALDIIGYGQNEDEAKTSLQISLAEFFKYTLNKNTFAIELKRLGWQKTKKQYQAPEITEQLSSNEQLRDILNHKQYTATNFDVSMPVFA